VGKTQARKTENHQQMWISVVQCKEVLNWLPDFCLFLSKYGLAKTLFPSSAFFWVLNVTF